MSEATEVKAAPTGKIAEALELISGMTVLELSQFVKAAEVKFGVTAAAPMAVAAAAAPAAPAAEEAAATVTVTLMSAGEQKLQTIKVVREVTNPPLGLKEAKALVDGAPKILAEGVTREDAAKMKEKLDAVGAKVEIK